MAKLEGGCLCGAVRYSGDAEPMTTVLCHCTNCQKQSGSPYSLNVVLPRGSLQISGEVTAFEDRGDTGMTVYRNFCPKCGSAIFNEPDAVDSIQVLKAGTLDDTGWLAPDTEIYCDSAMEWARLAGAAQSFPKMLPLG